MWSRPVAPEIPAGRRGGHASADSGRRLRRKGRCARQRSELVRLRRRMRVGRKRRVRRRRRSQRRLWQRCHRPSGVLNDERPRSRLGQRLHRRLRRRFWRRRCQPCHGAGPDAAAIPTAFRTTRSPAASTSLPSVCFRSRMRASACSRCSRSSASSATLGRVVFTHCCGAVDCGAILGAPAGFVSPPPRRRWFYSASPFATVSTRPFTPPSSSSPAPAQTPALPLFPPFPAGIANMSASADEPCESNTNSET